MDSHLPDTERARRAAPHHEARRGAAFAQSDAGHRLLSTAIQAAANALMITDRSGVIVYVNQAFTDMTGYAPEEALGRNPRFLKSGKHNAAYYQQMWERILAGKVWQSEVINRRKNGTYYTQEQTITPVCDAHGNITHFVAIQQDITSRKRMETELRYSRERFQKIFDANPVAIGICVQADSRFLDVNASYLRMMGYEREEIVGHSASELNLWVSPEQRGRLVAELKARGQVKNFEIQMRTKAGKVIEVLTSVEPMQLGLEPCWLFIDMDITAHKDLESQVRHVAKMESIGTLAGGVAHDFNNLLTVIQGHTDMLGLEANLPDRARESLQQIAAATERAAKLTQQLLTFSRKHPIQLRPVDLNEVLGGLARMLQRILGEDIALELVQAPRLPAILADAGLMEQVIFNLAANARDAMPDGGKLTFETRVTRRPAAAGAAAARPAAECVELVAMDCGLGIPPEVQSRIFEPFFTTKDVGKGTGLGLATVHGIVQQHQGWIEFDSRLGKGTSFHLFFPASSLSAQPAVTSPPASRVPGGGEIILLVEDEPEVRTLARDILQTYGYQVLEAASGVEALKVWKENQLRIDLVLTDVIMPHGLNGLQLARCLRADRPELKIIFTSGYASPLGAMDEMTAQDRRFYLQKPYAPSHLAQMIRDLLDQ